MKRPAPRFIRIILRPRLIWASGHRSGLTMQSPAVSIIMATYNRSNIIAHSIRSLLKNDLSDWELIVVGDACTDDTAAMVQAFADPRIRFINLPENFGEQSGPNNIGVSMARGRYLAFLNHDDLWFPDHLAHSLAVLEGPDAPDLVFGIGLAINTEAEPPALVGAATHHEYYHPVMMVPASLWVFRRELAERIGPWRAASDIRRMPSQDWLLRAHRGGARLAASPHLAALLISSISRENSYRDRSHNLHAHWARRLEQPDFPVAELIGACRRLENRRLSLTPLPMLLEAVKIASRKLLHALGIAPPALSYWWNFWRKGSYVRALRRRRGLPPDL